MQSISNDNGTLFYSKKGTGKKVLLAFHGYGQDHTVFESFSKAFNKEYTFYSFDIFYHGKSIWVNDELPLSKVQWAEYILLLLQKEGIETFEVLGYSMGGKFALTTAECFSKQCEKLFLLAPDGIKMNFWYRIITQYPISRFLFRYCVQHPFVYKSLSKVASIVQLAPKKLIDFADSMMDTEAKRQHVYNTWLVFRHLYTSPSQMDEFINTNGITTHIFIGQTDKIITHKAVSEMIKPVRNITMHVINSGHGKLIDETIRYIQTYNYLIQ